MDTLIQYRIEKVCLTELIYKENYKSNINDHIKIMNKKNKQKRHILWVVETCIFRSEISLIRLRFNQRDSVDNPSEKGKIKALLKMI